MNFDEIADVAIKVADILRNYGYPKPASWVSERSDLLSDTDATIDAKEHAASELHEIVLGMGGIFDLELRPAKAGFLSVKSAKDALDVLGERLYELTQ